MVQTYRDLNCSGASPINIALVLKEVSTPQNTKVKAELLRFYPKFAPQGSNTFLASGNVSPPQKKNHPIVPVVSFNFQLK